MRDRIHLQGARVVLREKTVNDAWNEFLWRTDPELAQLDAALPLTMGYDEFLDVYKEQLRYPLAWAKPLSVDTLDGAYIGNCMYYDVDVVRKAAEVGVLIGNRDYWNGGYGFDVVVTLIDHIFETTGLNRLYLHTLKWNKRARRCFEKCGFQPVRMVRRSQREFVYMEMLREEWDAMREGKLAARDALAKAGAGR